MGRDLRLHGEKPERGVNFNPLSPHGERHRGGHKLLVQAHFNPLSPHGERRADVFPVGQQRVISIHSPRMGRDGGDGSQPSPRRISIHSPRMGRDQTYAVLVRTDEQFQSTLPAWGET